MFCIRCGYPLKQLASLSCPECGRSFHPDRPETYSATPRTPLRERRLALTCVAVIGLYTLVIATHTVGTALGDPLGLSFDAVLFLSRFL